MMCQLQIQILYLHLAYTTVTIEVVLCILVIDKVKGKGCVPYLATEASWKDVLEGINQLHSKLLGTRRFVHMCLPFLAVRSKWKQKGCVLP